MYKLFGETLKKKRKEKGLSQKQLGDRLFVYHSTIARWENGTRLPDVSMIRRISECLDIDTGTLFNLATECDENPNVIMVDDNEIILSHGMTILGDAIPNAMITGFIRPVEAVEYAKINRVALAFLDIELGTENGLDLCHTLLEINTGTNVVFLTAYADYSLSAWETDAIGFILKPLTIEAVKAQLKKLRHPLQAGDSGK